MKPNGQSFTRDTSTEQRILDAAHAVFLRRGTAGARMQEIAEEAGVNKALLHYYFRNKERLAEAVFRQVAMQLLPPVIGVLAAPDLSIEEKVARVIELEFAHLSRSPFMPGYLISELNHRPERAEQLITSLLGPPHRVRPLVFNALAAQIEERVKAGTMRPITPEQFAVNLLSLCIFPFAARPMLTVMLGGGEEGFRQFIAERPAHLVNFFLGALRP
jgi:AcrR family transcriptional regulator